MSKGYPSMTALLGLLAVAGYQNRDKLAELLKGHGSDHGSEHGPETGSSTVPRIPSTASTAPGGTGASGHPLGNLLGGVGTAGIGGLIASGLSELVDHFTRSGHGETATSWVNQGPNRAIPEADLERAIGSETLDHLTQQTGLSRAALLARLSRDLPSAIDRYASDGRQPA
ncbi:YidB family protein [Methylobacterium sp. J-068]|uniref:YidB family protein n=1 Tax=Methylobacterium sp. J-068 TaxID=2836649 RepID=UPI001FB87593|nr:YidB family protein [Methylobacterium sp. J-068]MCJ2036072.1 YidB family protein [Methylobacterium sp. J-068]